VAYDRIENIIVFHISIFDIAMDAEQCMVSEDTIQVLSMEK